MDHKSRAQSIMAEKAWRQGHEAVSHTASTVRKQIDEPW